MSSETASIATSTPKAAAKDSKVLSEEFFNFSVINRESAEKFKRPRSVKKNRVAKENFNRNNQRRSPEKEDYSEKRRQQAIEAMKISEQRRLRLNQEVSTEEESIVESMANVSVTSVEYLPDGRYKLTRKELIARRDKQRRIMEFVAEQEARKKAQDSKNKRKCTFKPRSFAWSPRPVFKSTLNRDVTTKCCKRAQFVNEAPAIIKVEMKDGATQASTPAEVLRYAKDDLREMNPYGFYFL